METRSIFYTVCFVFFISIFIIIYHQCQRLMNKNRENFTGEDSETDSATGTEEKVEEKEKEDDAILITDDEPNTEYISISPERRQELRNIRIRNRDNVTISQRNPSVIKNIALTRVKPRKNIMETETEETSTQQPSQAFIKPSVQPTPSSQLPQLAPPVPPVPPVPPIPPAPIIQKEPEKFPYLAITLLVCGGWMIMFIIFIIASNVF